MADPWDSWDDERLWGYLRGDKGVGHASRAWLRDFLAEHGIGSLLDIGCGTGVEYEGIAADPRLAGLAYTGVDTCQRAVKLARKAFPQAKWQTAVKVGTCDAVLLRHVLEHQDRDAMQALVAEACTAARRCVVIVSCWPLNDQEVLARDGAGVTFNRWSLQDLALLLGWGGCDRLDVVRDLGPDKNTAIVGWKAVAAA